MDPGYLTKQSLCDVCDQLMATRPFRSAFHPNPAYRLLPWDDPNSNELRVPTDWRKDRAALEDAANSCSLCCLILYTVTDAEDQSYACHSSDSDSDSESDTDTDCSRAGGEDEGVDIDDIEVDTEDIIGIKNGELAEIDLKTTRGTVSQTCVSSQESHNARPVSSEFGGTNTRCDSGQRPLPHCPNIPISRLADSSALAEPLPAPITSLNEDKTTQDVDLEPASPEDEEQDAGDEPDTNEPCHEYRIHLLLTGSIELLLASGDQDPSRRLGSHKVKAPKQTKSVRRIEIRQHRARKGRSPGEGQFIGSIQPLAVANDATRPRGALRGRRVKDEMSMTLARSWIDGCKDRHLGRCQQDFSREWGEAVKTLQVIDLKRECVRHAPRKLFTFAAVSYTWGQVAQLRLLESTKAELFRDGSLPPTHPKLSRTARDAMELCKRLGYRYLWIDALCIQQDDPSAQQYGYMHVIYKAADLTIVSAAGSDANAGLPGLWRNSRQALQRSKKIRHMTLANVLNSYPKTMQVSRWESRGWTLQEKVLSNRMMIFTEYQVFWHCKVEVYPEDTICEDRWEDRAVWPEERVVGDTILEYPEDAESDSESKSDGASEASKKTGHSRASRDSQGTASSKSSWNDADGPVSPSDGPFKGMHYFCDYCDETACEVVWHCSVCKDFDFCDNCHGRYASWVHPDHTFDKETASPNTAFETSTENADDPESISTAGSESTDGATADCSSDACEDLRSSFNVAGPQYHFSKYVQWVKEYTHRNLTLDSDALHAFQGILGHLKDFVGPYHWALPKSLFAHSLKWDRRFFAAFARRPEYPSWSWIAWRTNRSEGKIWFKKENLAFASACVEPLYLDSEGHTNILKTFGCLALTPDDIEPPREKVTSESPNVANRSAYGGFKEHKVAEYDVLTSGESGNDNVNATADTEGDKDEAQVDVGSEICLEPGTEHEERTMARLNEDQAEFKLEDKERGSAEADKRKPLTHSAELAFFGDFDPLHLVDIVDHPLREHILRFKTSIVPITLDLWETDNDDDDDADEDDEDEEDESSQETNGDEDDDDNDADDEHDGHEGDQNDTDDEDSSSSSSISQTRGNSLARLFRNATTSSTERSPSSDGSDYAFSTTSGSSSNSAPETVTGALKSKHGEHWLEEVELCDLDEETLGELFAIAVSLRRKVVTSKAPRDSEQITWIVVELREDGIARRFPCGGGEVSRAEWLEMAPYWGAVTLA